MSVFERNERRLGKANGDKVDGAGKSIYMSDEVISKLQNKGK